MATIGVMRHNKKSNAVHVFGLGHSVYKSAIFPL